MSCSFHCGKHFNSCTLVVWHVCIKCLKEKWAVVIEQYWLRKVLYYCMVKKFGKFGEFGKSLPIRHSFFCQFSCFCNMRHAQQHEVRFNLFCIRIEVRILDIAIFWSGPVHFQAIVCYTFVITTDHRLYSAPRHHQTTRYWHVAQDKSWKIRSSFYYVHQCLELFY